MSRESTQALTREGLRVTAAVLAALFLLSCALNLGAKLGPLAFSPPSQSIGEFEVVIGLVLLLAATLSRLYVYTGAFLLATIGIVEGLLSSVVHGQARELHETMIPFLIVGWLLLAVEGRSSYKEGSQSALQRRQRLVTALQFFVGALVTLGGAAFASGGTYPVGTAIGLVHLVVGLTGLAGGYAIYRREPWARTFIIAINLVTIVWSAAAETLAEVYAYLPPGINDALVGTVVAVIASTVIIVLVRESS